MKVPWESTATAVLQTIVAAAVPSAEAHLLRQIDPSKAGQHMPLQRGTYMGDEVLLGNLSASLFLDHQR
jgi:hypothetical protein